MFGGVQTNAVLTQFQNRAAEKTLPASYQTKITEDRTLYDNGGITLPGTQFVGPGNKVIDDKGRSNFNALPNNCIDFVALEHDVAYHNATVTGKTDTASINKLDDKAINDALHECYSTQKFETLALVAGLKTKQHLESTWDNARGVFSSSQAVYPGGRTDAPIIPWFQPKSRRKNAVGNYETFITSTSG